MSRALVLFFVLQVAPGCGAGGLVAIVVGTVVGLDDPSSDPPGGRAEFAPVPSRDALWVEGDPALVPVCYVLEGTRRPPTVDYSLDGGERWDEATEKEQPPATSPHGVPSNVLWWDAAADLGAVLDSQSVGVRVRVYPGKRPGAGEESDEFDIGNTPPSVAFEIPSAVPEEVEQEYSGSFDVAFSASDIEEDGITQAKFFYVEPGKEPAEFFPRIPPQVLERLPEPENARSIFTRWDSAADLPGRRIRGVTLQLRVSGPFGEEVVAETAPFTVDNNSPPEAEFLWFFDSPTLDLSFEVPLSFRLFDGEANAVDVVVQWAFSARDLESEALELDGGCFDDPECRRQVLTAPEEEATRRAKRIATPARIVAGHRFRCGNGSTSTGTTTNAGVTCGLASLPEREGGVSHVFVWDAAADLPSLEGTSVVVRITPFDDVRGNDDTSRDFFVDNDVFPTGDAEQVGAGVTEGIGAGDLDGDGLIDLVVATPEEGIVEVFLRSAAGFSRAATLGGTALVAPREVILEDLDGSGRLDLVVTDDLLEPEDRLAIFMDFFDPEDPEREIEPAVISVGDDLRSIATGDFNGDGRTDLVVSIHDDHRLGVLLQDGSATYSVPALIPMADEPGLLDSADFDGDGRADVVVREREGSAVSIFVGTAAAPGLTFRMQIAPPGLDEPTSVAAGDFNGDGLTDLAIGDRRSQAVFLFFNLGAGPGGPLFPTIQDCRVDLARSPEDLVALDLTGDGIAELIAVESFEAATARLELLIDDGRCPWRAFKTIDLAQRIRSDRPRNSALVADLDADGTADLAVSTVEGVLVFPRDRPGSLVSRADDRDTILAAQGSSIEDLALADVDGDGLRDLVAAIDEGEVDRGRLGFFFQNQGGRFSKTPGLGLRTSAVPFLLAVEDRDDGSAPALIAVAVANGVDVFRRAPGGGFDPEPSSLDLGSIGPVLVGDFDGDAESEVLFLDTIGGRVRFIELDPGGSLKETGDLPTGDSPLDMAAGDMNCDGRRDLVVLHRGGRVDIYVQGAEGGGPFELFHSFESGAGTGRVALGRLGADERLDIMVVDTRDDRLLVFLQTEEGSYTAAPDFVMEGGGDLWAEVCDLNGDGADDIAAAEVGDDAVRFWFQREDGNFSLGASRKATIGDGFGEGASLLCGDFSGDGRPELLVLRPDGKEIRVLRSR